MWYFRPSGRSALSLRTGPASSSGTAESSKSCQSRPTRAAEYSRARTRPLSTMARYLAGSALS